MSCRIVARRLSVMIALVATVATVFGLTMVGCRMGGDFYPSQSEALTSAPRALVGRILGNLDDRGSMRREIANGRSTTSTDAVAAAAVTGALPVANAEVWLADLPTIPHVFTDASGSYRFEQVPAGNHTVVARFAQETTGQILKMRFDNIVVDDTSPTVTVPDVTLQVATNIVTGVLRDVNGQPLQAGTPLRLWGETFFIGTGGTFTTPPLPDAFSTADIEVVLPGQTLTVAALPFVSGVAPVTVDISVGQTSNATGANRPPSIQLTITNTSTTERAANRVDPQATVQLQARGNDVDSDDAGHLQYSWVADGGTLTVDATDNTRASWQAMAFDGMATITVRVTDTHGASATMALLMLVGIDTPAQRDVIAPTVVSRLPAPGAERVTTDSTVTVTFSKPLLNASINDSAINVASGTALISGHVTAGNNSKTLTFTAGAALPAGSVITVTVAATLLDRSGNALAVPVSWTFTTLAPDLPTLTDTTAPVVTAALLTTNRATPTLTGTIDDPTATVEVTVNGKIYTATITGTTWTVTIPVADALGSGQYDVQIAATDPAGNVGRDTTTNELTIDTTAPVVTVQTLTTNSPTPTLTGTIDDQTATVEVTVNGKIYTATVSGTTWTVVIPNVDPIPSGTHDVAVSATDVAGNIGANAGLHALIIDTNALTVTVTTLENPAKTSPIPVTVTFSKDVTGFTDTAITVTGGTKADFAAVDARQYTFNITSPNQGAVTVAIAANAAHDAAGNGHAAATLNVTYDSVAPTVTLTSTAADPTKTSPIPVTVTFNEDVSGFDVSKLTVSNGTAGNLQVVMVNRVWTVDVTPAGQGAVTVDLSANKAQDTAGNGNTAATQLSRTYDSSAPTVQNVTSTKANASYAVGATIDVTVRFNEVVRVTGTPRLTLETGTTDRVANYSSGDNTDTLTFNYTVQAGDNSNDLDYVSTTALALNSGTIRDAAGNDAVLTLPAPGTSGSLRANKALVIDGVAPTITAINTVAGDEIEIQFSETMNTGVTTAANYTISGGKGSLPDHPTSVTLVSDRTYRLVWASGLMTAGGNVTVTVANAKDAAGNAIGTPNSAVGATPLVVMDMVTVGDTGNAADTQPMNDGTTGYGTVIYSYRIGKFLVTNAQYCAFLNARAQTDTYGLYDSSMDYTTASNLGGIRRQGSSGSYVYDVGANFADKPVNYVSFYGAIRFINWLHNGAKATSGTETGAYAITGGGDNAGTIGLRNAGSRFVMPTEHEWYKAAYYDPSKGGAGAPGYWLYATKSDDVPTLATANATNGTVTNGGANVANHNASFNWNGQTGHVSSVGGCNAPSGFFLKIAILVSKSGG